MTASEVVDRPLMWQVSGHIGSKWLVAYASIKLDSADAATLCCPIVRKYLRLTFHTWSGSGLIPTAMLVSPEGGRRQKEYARRARQTVHSPRRPRCSSRLRRQRHSRQPQG